MPGKNTVGPLHANEVPRAVVIMTSWRFANQRIISLGIGEDIPSKTCQKKELNQKKEVIKSKST